MEQKFKTYTGTQTIKAMPMVAARAQDAGANVPGKILDLAYAAYDPGAEGYLVEYPDGYRSWSPKAVFEATYRISDTHVDRMMIELEELSERICKATKSLNTFGAIPHDRRGDLRCQLEAMRQYAEILHDRIDMETRTVRGVCYGGVATSK